MRYLLLILYSTIALGSPSLSVLYKNDAPILRIDAAGKTTKIRLHKMPSQTSLYHWTHEEWAKEVDAQGSLTTANMDHYLQKGKAKKFRQFGGFYVSADMWDSSWYGDELLILSLDQDILLAPFDQTFHKSGALKAYDNDPIALQTALVSIGISGTYKKSLFGKRNWISILDHKVANHIRRASRLDYDNPLLNYSFLFEDNLLSILALEFTLHRHPRLLKSVEFVNKMRRRNH